MFLKEFKKNIINFIVIIIIFLYINSRDLV